MVKVKYFYILVLYFFLAFGCSDPSQTNYQFELLNKDVTGLNFNNQLVQSKEFNVFSYMYFFNGAGVGAGDFNNDGKQDLYFASNMGSNKLFLNEGDLKFKDVTVQAKVDGGGGWSSGVSIVDINNDNLLDIYVNQVGNFKKLKGRNRLYINKGINNGIPVFEEQAAQYGLDIVGFCTQSVFFDYDLDGDLDLFQLNHSVHENGTFGERASFLNTEHAASGDKLYRNDSGVYVDFTKESGINSMVIGYGLGVVMGDINNDGWPDIYVGNDFHENDYLYINQKNGTFKEMLNEQIMHTSRFSMGVDIGDINNDGYSEIYSLDMQPYDPYILKRSLGEDDYDIFHFKLKYGYNVQFARNNLQLNNGDDTFSEIGMFAGVQATDWSWAPLFTDFNNDGFKDLFVSNGIPRRMNDIDYVNFRESNSDHRWKTQANMVEDKDLFYIDKIPEVKLPNKIFRNTGDLKFVDISKQVKGSADSYSNGAAYADLDSDGDMDVIVNNINEEPYIYKNLTIENKEGKQHYLSLKFKGSPENIQGIGTRVIVFKHNEQIVYENFPVRGFQSCVESGLHIGIGDTTAVDSILVIWPDRSYQNVTGLKYDSSHIISWTAKLPYFNFKKLKKDKELLNVDFTVDDVIGYRHEENSFIEFNRERLIPFMVSTEGPAAAVGDINGDGLDDVFFGSSKREKSSTFFQNKDGTFDENTALLIQNDSIFEDVDAVFADIDNDGDLDLAVASGGNEYWGTSEYLKQRLYLNNGQGNFTERYTFPDTYLTASCVLASDFNDDGLIDFFFGGRAVPNNYGKIPNSYLFQNKGNARFEDVTKKYSSTLGAAGMVKDGHWIDLEHDGDMDLVLAVEWEPIMVFLNDGQAFKKLEITDEKGWWTHVLPHDFDGDGDVDILAGNVGKNTRFKPTFKTPLKLYINDFDDNDQMDQVLTYHLGGREIPFANHYELTKQMPFLKKKFLYAKDFASASIDELFGSEKIQSSNVLEVNSLENVYLENTGALKFKVHYLPDELQFSSLQASAVHDFQGLTGEKVLLGGNFYDNNIEMGRYDANYGNLLSIGKNGSMKVYPLGSLNIKGQVREIKQIVIDGKTCFIFVRNNEEAVTVEPVMSNGKSIAIRK